MAKTNGNFDASASSGTFQTSTGAVDLKVCFTSLSGLRPRRVLLLETICTSQPCCAQLTIFINVATRKSTHLRRASLQLISEGKDLQELLTLNVSSKGNHLSLLVNCQRIAKHFRSMRTLLTRCHMEKMC